MRRKTISPIPIYLGIIESGGQVDSAIFDRYLAIKEGIKNGSIKIYTTEEAEKKLGL